MNEDRAELARQKARELGETLHAKQEAYGDSGAIALGLWLARLAQYRVRTEPLPSTTKTPNPVRLATADPEGDFLLMPVALIAHLPRITRLDDRINRIVSNPAGDRMGESPWMDAAGDCIIGEIAPRVGQVTEPAPRDSMPRGQEYAPCLEPECELARGHEGRHATVNAAGRFEWRSVANAPETPRRTFIAWGDGYREDIP